MKAYGWAEVQLHVFFRHEMDPSVTLTHGEEPFFSFCRKLGGNRGPSGCGAQDDLLLVPTVEPRFFGY
jgi:hypothetical protein